VGLAATVTLLNDDDDAIGLPVVVVTVELEVRVFLFWFVLPSFLLDAVSVAITLSKLPDRLLEGEHKDNDSSR